MKCLVNRKINDIVFCKNILFLATDSGVISIDYETSNLLSFISEKDGLISNQCKKIVLNSNYLWVATNSGLSKIELDSDSLKLKSILNYTRSDGLISNFINDILIKKDTAWIATNEGISAFPKNMRKQVFSPILNIIEAKTNFFNLDIYRPIELSPNKNNISITYSNMMFPNNKDSYYEYRLLPYNSLWTTTDKNSITFSDLAPNSYTFEVRSVGAFKYGVHNSTQLEFKVLPSFTQTLLFKLLLLIISLTLLALFINWRMRLTNKKAQVEKMITQLELEAIKAQINPHFIYNCLNSIKNTIIKQDNLNAEEQLSVFAKLVRQTLNISKKNFITLEKEIDYLNNYLEMEKIRFKEKLNFSIDLTNITNSALIQLPSMLIQPFVENAIKHGSPIDENTPSIININFSLKGYISHSKIMDNGPGIKSTNQKKPYKSQGNEISLKRASTYNKLYDTNVFIITEYKINKGTLITISIPQKNLR